MQLNKTGKIAVAVVATIAAAGALHVLLFQDRAEDYDRALSQFQDVSQRYVSQGIPPETSQIHRFRYETVRNKLDYWETIRDMELALPAYYNEDGGADEVRQQEDIWSVLERLEELREAGEAGEGPRLTFMGDGGWNILRSHPQGVPTGNQLAQRIEELWGHSETLRVFGDIDDRGQTQQRRPGQPQLTPEEQQRRQQILRFEFEYRRLLNQVGLDLNRREQNTERFGNLYATLHTLNRVRLIKDALPDDFWEELTDQEKLERLYQIYRLEWPKDNLGNVNYLPGYRQGLALIEMIETAGEEGIPEVEYVRTHTIRPLTYVEPPDPDADEEEVDEFDMMWDPMMMMDPMMMEMGAMGFEDMDMMGMGFGGMGMVEEEPEELVANIAPIELIVRGDGQDVMRYMYRINNKRRPYELDRFRFRRVEGQDGQVRFQGFYNVGTYAMYLGLMREDYVEYNIVEARRELAEIAEEHMEAVRDLALRDGILSQIGEEYELAEPTPTPYPTPEGGFPDFSPPEPEPEPAMDPGMMAPGMMDPGAQPQPGAPPEQPAAPAQPGMEGLEGMEGMF